MSVPFLSDENDTTTFNLTHPDIIQLTTSTQIEVRNESIWNDIQSFFNLQNSLIILVIIFFFCTFCLVFVLIQLMRRKRLYKSQVKSQANIQYPFRMKNSSAPTRLGLPVEHIVPTEKGFPPMVNKIKRTWNEKSMTSSNIKYPSSLNNDEIETVNEVLAMEERHGKVFYKVNFTGHSPDYTAWVCQEDLIPE